MATGVLLINLGTPESYSASAVRRYLRQFLMDERVVDIPTLARWVLVNCIIAPFRAKSSAKAYQAIWTEQGSPLLIHSQHLCQQVQQTLGQNYQVALGMRYGEPSIDTALDKLKSCPQLIIIPLYPQYSSAATGSSIEYTLESIKKWNTLPQLQILSHFYQYEQFLNAQNELMSQHIDANDFVLFSYHGLPERQLHKSGCKQICTPGCSNQASNTNTQCYRYQCYQTTAKLIEQLKLDANQTKTCFQSRLGKTPWIKPYTDEVLIELAKNNIKNVAIVCPSFVADCLETIEEIGMQARQQWQELGGKSFKLIPCINNETTWVNGLSHIIESLNLKSSCGGN